ncbi:glycoside hydrolase family 76 protein [Actinophytocola gossypii]|uniref:glycoside hydrolase family 76 protein n=1 Tax=Actinophytocola gossypii TaxID=2812003 RepID=UPI0021A41BCB|nr:glycoside hydrolase family 76 protein [Actinophytocola gossypii]
MSQRAEYAGSPTEESPSLWAARAAVAERAVLTRHLRRFWGLPGTRLGVAAWPPSARQRLHTHWNYWWQAHLLDCLVDAQQRQPHPGRAATIHRLVRGIRLRNLSWTNAYYDDIAWLGLALLRAHECEQVPVQVPLTAITAQLRDGWTDHAGGGVWWRRGDNFKNVPANGPAAILFARWASLGGERADRQRARSHTEWMEQLLVDPGTGLLWDGLYVEPDGTVRDVVRTVYTYCQGVFLGACVELAAEDTSGVWVGRAERTIRAVATHLVDHDVLRGRGGGDGGLFAGILARYLALAAARLPGLGSDLGPVAARVVIASAQAAWRNRALARGGPLFGPEWTRPADVPHSARHRRVERDLSVQLSAWMVLEAAAMLERLGSPG